jgi:hypothetical protein
MLVLDQRVPHLGGGRTDSAARANVAGASDSRPIAVLTLDLVSNTNHVGE